MSCTVSVPNNGAPVSSGQTVPLTVTASGGTAPYTLGGQNFTSTLTVSKTYTNTSSANTVVTESVNVSDAAGKSVSCSASVTVTPVGGSSSGLKCTLALNPTVLRTGTAFQLTGTISGGKTPYSIQSFDLPGATLTSVVQPTSSSIMASGSYSTTGLRTSTLVVKDADLNQYSCLLTYTILNPPSMTLSAAPSDTVETGTPVAISVSTNGFTGTPSVTFTANDPKVTVTPLGGGAIVQSSDKLPHTFIVTANASFGTETAQATLPITFSAYVPLTCTLTTSGTLKTGQDITYKYVATNGDALILTEFTPGTDGVAQAYNSDNVVVKYYHPGSKTTTLKAVSNVSGKECQNGSALTSTLSIANALSCTVSPASTSVARGSLTTITATVPNDAPFGPFWLTEMFVSPSTYWTFWGNSSSTGAYATFYNAGSFGINMKVQDLYGNTATCNGTQVVY